MLEFDVSLLLLKYLCSLFIEKNFNLFLFLNLYWLLMMCIMYSLLLFLWRFCRYFVWNRLWICLYYLKENKLEFCIDLYFKVFLVILLLLFVRRIFILVVEVFSWYFRLLFVICKYIIFLYIDVYWFFFCVMILCCVL